MRVNAMPNWGWALLLKPFIGIVWFAFLFGSARLIAAVLWRVLPESRVKAALFAGWHRRRAGQPTHPHQRVLDHAPLVRGEPGEDRSRL